MTGAERDAIKSIDFDTVEISGGRFTLFLNGEPKDGSEVVHALLSELQRLRKIAGHVIDVLELWEPQPQITAPNARAALARLSDASKGE